MVLTNDRQNELSYCLCHQPIVSYWSNYLAIVGRIFKSTEHLCKSIPVQADGA